MERPHSQGTCPAGFPEDAAVARRYSAPAAAPPTGATLPLLPAGGTAPPTGSRLGFEHRSECARRASTRTFGREPTVTVVGEAGAHVEGRVVATTGGGGGSAGGHLLKGVGRAAPESSHAWKRRRCGFGCLRSHLPEETNPAPRDLILSKHVTRNHRAPSPGYTGLPGY